MPKMGGGRFSGPQKMNFKALGKIINLIIKENAFLFILMIASTIISALFNASAMTLSQTLFDEVIPALRNSYNDGLVELKQLMFKYALYFGVSILCSITSVYSCLFISLKTIRKVRNLMFINMQYLPVRYFDQNKFGDIMSRYTNDADALNDFIGNTLPNFVSCIISVSAVFVMMLINNWLLTLIVLGILIIILLINSVLLKSTGKFFGERQKLLGKLNGNIEEMMEGTKVVQVFNHQEKAIEEFDILNREFCKVELKANCLGNIVGPLNGNLVRLEYVFIVLIGSLFCVNGYSIGKLASFLTLTSNFTMPISRMAEQIMSIAQASAGADRVINLINEKHEDDNGYVTLVKCKEIDGKIVETEENTHKWAWKHPHNNDGSITYTPLKGEIVLDNVDFGYDPEKQILFDINVLAKPGQKIALVGETGAGKTTITNLINRFYDIEDGKIRYDGININKIKKNDLRKSLGLVLQDTNLFTGTIKENIMVGKSGATMEEVVNAAKIANADSFIRMMPNGYDTVLERAGEKLSQGQRQLIAIARAAIADCPVLILDEATSSIDTRTELIIQKGMDELMKNRTTFVIAHRLSTIQSADSIMVMSHGKIIERGTHEELIKKKGVYYELYTGKFEME